MGVSEMKAAGDGFAAAAKPTRRRFAIPFMLLIGVMVVNLDRVNVSILAANDPFLLEMGIKGQAVQIGMLMTSFLAAYGVGNLLLSPLGDYLGPRKAMTAAFISFIVSLAAGGFAGTFMMMIASRVILGLGEGLYFPMQALTIKNWFPQSERGRANATWIVGQSLAPAIAMPLYAFVIASHGWRFSFFMAILFTLVPLYLIWFYLTDTPRQNRRVNSVEADYIEQGSPRQVAAKGRATFWTRIGPFARDYRYWLLVMWNTGVQCIAWGLAAWLPAYLKTARGFSWMEMGWMASLPFIFSIFTKSLSGWACDRIGRAAPVLALAMFLGAVLIVSGTVAANKYLAAVLLSLAYSCSTMGAPAAWTLLSGLAPGDSLSMAGGGMNGIGNGVSSLSPVLMGFFIAFTGGYDGALFGVAGMCLVGMAFALLLSRQNL